MKRVVDLLLLIAAAFVACVTMLGAYLFVKVHHYSPLWVFFSFVSIVFLANAREEYRKEFRSSKFVCFVLSWIVINMVVIVVVLSFLHWVYLIPALVIEQGVFYMSAHRFFGILPSEHPRQS